MNTVKRASTRASMLDYAKRKVKAPTLAPVGFTDRGSSKIVDYAKASPLKVGYFDGPLTLDKLGKPAKVNTKVRW